MLTAIHRIISEAGIVARAIERHELLAQRQCRLDEAEAMHNLGYGVARMVMDLTDNPPVPQLQNGSVL